MGVLLGFNPGFVAQLFGPGTPGYLEGYFKIAIRPGNTGFTKGTVSPFWGQNQNRV